MAGTQPNPDRDELQEQRAKRAAYMRAYRAANREKYKEIDREAERRKRERDLERFKERSVKRQQRYRKRQRAAMTPEDRERLKEANRRRNQAYRDRHKGETPYVARRRENARQRYAADPVKHLEVVKRYQATPQGAANVRANNRKRLARLKAAQGDVTAADWRAILKAHENRCRYCRKELTEKGDATMDHVTPLTKGGTHTPDNVVPACRRCNSKKYNKTPEEFAAQAAAQAQSGG